MMNDKTTDSEQLTAREIVNFIMNGGKTATGEGRKNLQQTGIEMINEFCERRRSPNGEVRPLEALISLRKNVETAVEILEEDYIMENKSRMGALASQNLHDVVRILKQGLNKTNAG